MTQVTQVRKDIRRLNANNDASSRDSAHESRGLIKPPGAIAGRNFDEEVMIERPSSLGCLSAADHAE
jgi:hypothetical protein